MKRILSLIIAIIVCKTVFSQNITIQNKTGEVIQLACFIKTDSIVNDSTLTLFNKVHKQIDNGQSIKVELSKGIYNIHAFSGNEIYNGNIYFIPYWNSKNKKVEITKDCIESNWGIISGFAPRAFFRILNQTGLKLYEIYYKPHPNKEFSTSNLISSWQPIQKDEIRPIRFLADMNIDANGEYIFENLDLKIIAISDKGKTKEILINNFDCVNNDNLIVK
jgi:hypothetical protein